MNKFDNKQINVWRGSETPPTNYHMWIFTDFTIKLYINGEWTTFIDNASTAKAIIEIIERLDSLEDFRDNVTINSKLVKDSPTLDATDLLSKTSGAYVEENDNVADALMKIDELLTTQII